MTRLAVRDGGVALEDADRDVVEFVDAATRFRAKGYERDPRYRAGAWGGWARLVGGGRHLRRRALQRGGRR